MFVFTLFLFVVDDCVLDCPVASRPVLSVPFVDVDLESVFCQVDTYPLANIIAMWDGVERGGELDEGGGDRGCWYVGWGGRGCVCFEVNIEKGKSL